MNTHCSIIVMTSVLVVAIPALISAAYIYNYNVYGFNKKRCCAVTHRGTNVFGCFLDAFDLVDHGILFQKLLNRGLPSIYSSSLFVVVVSKSTVECALEWSNI